ncbi:MAG: hypothetical protein O3C43_10225 [Verrucomicrobia bacterium]|nr:hypothetical protein [Verrucomicrobiota bacterium]MDA1066869.1 hypothetical protein [Verrucomicrobiota bacterium]
MQKSDDEIQGLLMGLLDGELNAEEANYISDLLRKNERWRHEYDSLLEAHTTLQGLSFEEPGDKVLRELWRSPYSRFAKEAAIWMIIGGYSILFFIGLYSFFFSNSGGWQFKLPLAAIVIGGLTYLTLMIRERIATHKVDPYKEVKR